MSELRIAYEINLHPTVVGLKTVLYRDADTGKVLGGWDTFEDDEKIETIIEKNKSDLIAMFNEYWNGDREKAIQMAQERGLGKLE